jgi:hypothetical protein
MGIDWENILDTGGTGLDDAYDAAVSAIMYPDRSRPEAPGSFAVVEAHDETDDLNL